MSLDVTPSHPGEPELVFEPTMLDSEPVASGEIEQPIVPAMRAEPVSAAERLASVDVLRGFALLGILAMNIVAFGWPGPAYGDPMRGGGFEGTDRAVWFFNHLFFEVKMMTIFSMLFGAGLVLMNERAGARGASLRGVYYRRVLWLLVIGAIHAYLVWSGDVLFLYAECGLILYLFRNKTAKTLIIVGVSLMLLIVPLVLGFGAVVNGMKTITARVDSQIKSGENPSRFARRIHEIWTDSLQKEFKPTPEQKLKNWNKGMDAYRGGYLGIVKHRAFDLLMEQTVGFLLIGFLFAGSRMLLGMGLMKLGVFSAERSRSFYIRMAALGYGISLPLMLFDASELIRHRFESDYLLQGGIFYNIFGSLVVALGHVGVIMLIVRNGALSWLTSRQAAVGRMALSNYLAHSLICTTLFYGYGFGLFGRINRTGLAGIVLCIWLLQLWLSPIWLRHFRFGPAEWVWRSLTYWKRQPMWRPETTLAAVG
jgi:uncharacterized protein